MKAQKRIAELKRDIARLGTPNLGAIEEFERVNSRYTYLSEQRDDIQKAKTELERIIRDITNEMRTIFAHEFQILNESFRETFTELFEGGRAELILEDENDILNCGIEIKVQRRVRRSRRSPCFRAGNARLSQSPFILPF